MCFIFHLDNIELAPDDKILRLLEFGVLLSKDRSLCWKDSQILLGDIQHLLNMKISISLEIYKTHVSNSQTLQFNRGNAVFAQEEYKASAFWALVMCSNTKSLLEWLFEKRYTELIFKYFRTSAYKWREDERCVILPPTFNDQFTTLIIEEHINQKEKTKEHGMTEKEKSDIVAMKGDECKCIFFICTWTIFFFRMITI